MGELLKLALTIYVLSLVLSMVIAVIKFVVDTWRWHDPEKRVHITKSAFEADLKEEETEEQEESEVNDNGEFIDESTEHNTSAFSIFGG